MFRSMLLLPSILHRIDHLLVMTELNVALFDNKYGQDELLVAMTPASAYAEFDYERLELLGVSSMSCHHYCQYRREIIR